MVKNLPANAGDTRDTRCMFNPWVRKIPGVENDNQLQYSCLENPKERRAWGLYSPWGHKELDIMQHAHTHTHTQISRRKLCFTWVQKHTTVIHLSARVRD